MDWDTLIDRIARGQCTPFLGAGASCVPSAETIAKEWFDIVDKKWRREQHHPFPGKVLDSSNLAEVAQALAISIDPSTPRDLMTDICRKSHKGGGLRKIHQVLATLPFPVYITTNYDSFMCQALESADKKPKRTWCRWGERIVSDDFSEPPSPQAPYVYHLHGYYESPESMVITIDDYLSFLAWMSRPNYGLPPEIQGAFSKTLLFIGYSLRDWNFRVLIRNVMETVPERMKMLSISVQLRPEAVNGLSKHYTQKVLEYLQKYWNSQIHLALDFVWMEADDFALELQKRWKSYGKLKPPYQKRG